MKTKLISVLVLSILSVNASAFEPIKKMELLYDGAGCYFVDPNGKNKESFVIATDANYKGVIVGYKNQDLLFLSSQKLSNVYRNNDLILKVNKIKDLECDGECASTLMKATLTKNGVEVLSKNLIETCGS